MLVQWHGRPAYLNRWLANDPRLGAASSAPLADVTEDERGYSIAVELPGVPASAVKVDLDGGRLVISGEKKQETSDSTDRFFRIERRFGSFRRTFEIPETVDRTGIQAKLVDGLLTVTLPKTPVAQPRSIPVAAQ